MLNFFKNLQVHSSLFVQECQLYSKHIDTLRAEGNLENRVPNRFINITLTSMERFPETLQSEAFGIYLYRRCEYGLIDCQDR